MREPILALAGLPSTESRRKVASFSEHPVTAFWVAVLSAFAPGLAAQEAPDISLEEKRLYKAPGEEDVDAEKAAISPDGRRIALEAATRDGDRVAWVDERWEKFALLSRPVWSHDSKRVAYVSREADSEKFFVVLDGKKSSPSYDSLDDLVFSPNSAQLAYTAGLGEMQFVVAGDRKGPEFKDIRDPPVWSPDSKGVAYLAQNAAEKYVIVAGERKLEYIQAFPPLYSSDGILGYVAMRAKGEAVVPCVFVGNAVTELVDDQGEPFEGAALGPFFGRDSRDVAWIAVKSDDQKFIFVNGKRFQPKHAPSFLNLAVGPGGKLAWWTVIKEDTKAAVVVCDGERKETKGPDWILHPDMLPLAWSPDGSRVAHIALKMEKDDQTSERVVIGEKLSEPFEDIWGPPRFSADGKRVAFGYRKENAVFWRVLKVD